MNRDEILARSRKENKDQDIFEKEVIQRGKQIAAYVAMGLVTIFS